MKLKNSIASIFDETQPERAAVNHLVNECYRLSRAYLQKKARTGSLQLHHFGLSVEDLAMDSFAELFQRDDKGRFHVLTKYFGGMNWKKMSEQELFVALRRLVFSKVNESLFRSYREADPNLAKIIRNIKGALKSTSSLALVRCHDGAWLVIGDESTPLNANPVAPIEVLEAYLVSHLCRGANSYDAVDSFVSFIEDHPHYRNGYPLSGFAQALRAAFIQAGTLTDEPDNDQMFLDSEVERAIELATKQVQAEKHRSYVEKGKVSGSLFDTYFQTVRRILASHFTAEVPPASSYFEALQTYLPDMSRESFSANHRNILQYMTELSRTKMVNYLQDEPAC